jgi:hypothetical protein
MALPTLHIVAILQRELKLYECSASTLASLAGISGSKLTSYLNETNRCPVEHDVKLRKAWVQFKKLVEYTDPLRLDYSKTGALRKCIDMMESGELQIVVFRTSDQIESAEVQTHQ